MSELTKEQVLNDHEALLSSFPPFQPGSDTSFKAAEEIAEAAPNIRAAVLALLVNNPEGLTDEEIANELNVFRMTAAARRNELMNVGFAKDSNERRFTTRGRPAVVWVPTKAALDLREED